MQESIFMKYTDSHNDHVQQNIFENTFIEVALTEKGRLSGASLSEKMFEHISIITSNFRVFVFALDRVNIQDYRL